MKGTITEIREHNEEIKGFRLKLSEPISFVPGKYVMLSFADSPDVKRAFSVVEYDREKNEILVIIKKNGSFTSRLFMSKAGEEVMVYGPYGRFTLPAFSVPLVFIAGGIGITPLYSMLNHVHASGYDKNLYLFYATKSRESMVLQKEIQEMHDNRIRTEFFYTAEGGKRITAEDMKKVPEFNESLFYICGPAQMIESLRNELIAVNISEERIKSEEFC